MTPEKVEGSQPGEVNVDRVRLILAKLTSSYAGQIYVGKAYTIAQLQSDLRELISDT